MKRIGSGILVGICCLLCLTACYSGPAGPEEGSETSVEREEETILPAQSPVVEEPPAVEGPEQSPPQSPRESGTGPLTDEEISLRYTQAITALEEKVTLDVSGREWKFGVENDLKNIYYSVLAQHPELKYAYDMTAEEADGRAVCTFHYMPYRTGAYAGALPEGSHRVGSLHDADVMAQSMIDGTERLSIAITDPELEVEDLQRAVGQAGYGWISYTLSRDGTEIVAVPATGMTLPECVEGIDESFRLTGELLKELVTDEMTDREKVEAVYGYITEKVAYDFRYYSGKNDMPFESTVALGALRDSLAICGGYAHALETMLDMCGIKNSTVSGTSKGEYHAWNYVVLDGQGYYCDPTADRHGLRNHFLLTAEELEGMGGYIWDSAFYSRLWGTEETD